MASLKGTKLGKSHTVLVKDCSPYDAELALAIASLNAVSQKTWPDMGYVAAGWVGGQAVREQVMVNIENVIAEHVKGAIGRNDYHLAQIPEAFRRQCSVVQSQSGGVPSLNVSDFELTIPSASNELHLTQEFVDKGKRCGKVPLPDSEVWKGMTWADILKKHNDEFNPAGTTRGKRAADVSVQEFLSCN